MGWENCCGKSLFFFLILGKLIGGVRGSTVLLSTWGICKKIRFREAVIGNVIKQIVKQEFKWTF